MLTTQQVYAMLENESLWQTATQCHQLLSDAKVPHAVMGGVAVCLHGYQRNTVDLDLLIRKEDSKLARETLEGMRVQLLLAGDRAGIDSEVNLPDPDDTAATTEIEDLPVLTLAKLIESKIACGLGNLRRTHKDFADVVELILQNRLNSSFARYLHKSLRTTYRSLVRTSRGKA
jgi:hypothetical protein